MHLDLLPSHPIHANPLIPLNNPMVSLEVYLYPGLIPVLNLLQFFLHLPPFASCNTMF